MKTVILKLSICIALININLPDSSLAADKKNSGVQGVKHKDTAHEKHDAHEEHTEGEKHDEHASGDPHADEDSHDDHSEKGEHEEGHEEEEESTVVGPDKGIPSASKVDGIKLSPEAVKNFSLRMLSLSGTSPWIVPASSVVYSAREVNLFRFRQGFFKRIDFKIVSKTSVDLRVASDDLKVGDAVVVNGLGFLRVAEIAAFGGAPEGHSH